MTAIKNFITLLLCLSFVDCLSQQKIVEYYQPAFKQTDATVALFAGKDSSFFADIENGEESKRLFIQKDSLPTVIYNAVRGTGENNIIKIRSTKRIETIQNTGDLLDCYYAEKEKSIYLLSADLSSAFVKPTDTITFGEDEFFIAVLKDNDKLYILSYLDNSDVIYIRVKGLGEKLRVFEKTIKVSSSSKGKKAPHFSDFFKIKERAGYFIYDNTHPYPANLSGVKEKIYHFPGKVFFTLENFNLQTNIVGLSLKDFSHRYYSVPLPFEYMPDEYQLGRTTCSFLSDSILFKTGSYNNLFFITATDIHTGNVKYSRTMQLGKNDNLQNNPFFITAEYDKQAEQVKNKLRKYLDYPSISVQPIGEGKYELEISSLYKTVTLPQILLSLGMSYAGTYAINSIPNTWGYIIFLFYSTKSVSIKNKLDLNTGSFSGFNQETPSATGLWQQKLLQVNDFVQKHTNNNPGTLISAGNIYVYFIDTTEGKLFVYKF